MYMFNDRRRRRITCPDCQGAGYCTIHIIESWFSWPKAVKAKCSRCWGRGWYWWR
jgi:DnaJ-class molecular chaperone